MFWAGRIIYWGFFRCFFLRTHLASFTSLLVCNIVMSRNYFCDRHTVGTHCRRACICSTASSSKQMLQVIRVLVNGICSRPSELAICDFIHTADLTNFSIKILEAADKWSVIPLLLRGMLQHPSRTAEAAEVSISIEAVLATIRTFDAEKCYISCTNNYFIPRIKQLNIRVTIFWPRRSRPCRRPGPFHTLPSMLYIHTCFTTFLLEIHFGKLIVSLQKYRNTE